MTNLENLTQSAIDLIKIFQRMVLSGTATNAQMNSIFVRANNIVQSSIKMMDANQISPSTGNAFIDRAKKIMKLAVRYERFMIPLGIFTDAGTALGQKVISLAKSVSKVAEIATKGALGLVGFLGKYAIPIALLVGAVIVIPKLIPKK